MYIININRISSIIARIKTSTLAKSSGIYTISGFINAAIPLLLLPILTRKLSPSDYGIIAMFQLALSFVYPFVGLNLDGAIERTYYDDQKKAFPSYIGACFFLALCSFFTIYFFFYVDQNYLETVFQIPKPWLKYIVIVSLCQFCTAVVLVLFQVSVAPYKYGILQIGQSILNVGLTLYFVLLIGKTWQGRLEAQIITAIIFSIISIGLLSKKRQISFRFKTNDLKSAFRFGVPLIPHAIGGIIFIGIDRFFLTRMVGLEQTGNYTVAYQLGACINLVTFAFNNAYVPWLFANLSKKDNQIKHKIVKFTYYYFGVLLIGAALLLLVFPVFVKIFVGHNFKNIDTYSTFIVFGFVFQGMYYMVINYITYVKKTYLQALLTISVAFIKIPITYFAITWLGAIGASVSYCLTFFIFFISTWILSAHVYKMPWFNATKAVK